MLESFDAQATLRSAQTGIIFSGCGTSHIHPLLLIGCSAALLQHPTRLSTAKNYVSANQWRVHCRLHRNSTNCPNSRHETASIRKPTATQWYSGTSGRFVLVCLPSPESRGHYQIASPQAQT